MEIDVEGKEGELYRRRDRHNIIENDTKLAGVSNEEVERESFMAVYRTRLTDADPIICI